MQSTQAISKLLISGFLFLEGFASLHAQCSGGSSGGALSPAPSNVFQTMSVSAGSYYTFTANCGDVFTFSFCQGGGQHGSLNTEDTQLTILDNSGSYAGAYNDDDLTCNCGCSTGSEVVWTATSSGTYRLLVNRWNCSSIAFVTSPVKVAYKYVAVAAPASSPGGIYCGLTSWLKADNSSTLTFNSGNVSAWSSSYGSVTVSQATASKQPAFKAGSVSYTSFSYMPCIKFSTSSSTALNNSSLATDLLSSTGTTIIISDRSTVTGTLFSFETSGAVYKYQFKPKFRIQTSSNASTGYTFDFSAPTAYPTTSACELTNLATGANQQIKLNSVLNSSCSNCNSSTYLPAISAGLYLGSNNTSEYADNNLAEVITFGRTLSSTELDKVESYVSIKYGIMRGSNASPQDYYSSSGSTIWSTSSNSGYTNDAAGIGRDDAGGLNKKQSISVNTGEAVTIGLTSIASDNASNANTFSSDNSFLLWGNNGGSLIADNTLSLPACVASRLKRVWKTQATNFSQNVTVGFETSLLLGYTPLSNLYLLLDDDGNFSDATCVSGAVLNGTRIEFSGIDLYTASHRYFTLATIDEVNTNLPIELLSFTGECVNRGLLLNWATAQEHDVSRMSIEKSPDAVSFKEIYSVAGHLNKGTTSNYFFLDSISDEQIIYYRLVEYDLNGAKTYFNMINIINDCDENEPIIFPNPSADGVFRVQFRSHNSGLQKICVHSSLGQTILERSIDNAMPVSEYELDLGSCANGIYFVELFSGEKRFLVKISIQN